MFWRLFASYLALVSAAVVLVGWIAFRRSEELFWALTAEVGGATTAVVLAAVPIAYYLARRFTRPLHELAEGAHRLAEGDFALRIRPAGSSEVRDLANTFNIMTDRLALSFTELEHDKEQLRIILSGMADGVVAFDNDHRVVFANDRAAQLLEFPPDAFVGRKLWEVTRQRTIQEVADKALRGVGPYREELDWKGTAVKSLAIYALRLPGPNSPGAVMVLHDTTEIRRLERLRQDFVANVSHELKTPLANIKSSVEVLIDGAAEDPATRGIFLTEIDDQANRLDALVGDLLSLARLESGDTPLEFENVPVEDAVHACLDRHRTRAEAKKLTLDGVALVGCPHNLAVRADDRALAQVLDNLVDNAIKYTPNGGRVTARWEVTTQHVCIEIVDTGIGIPEKDLPHVFERFYRVDKARSREMGGTGLGLAIVKHVTQAMKGHMKVTSVLGQGTTFRVCLPKVAES